MCGRWCRLGIWVCLSTLLGACAQTPAPCASAGGSAASAEFATALRVMVLFREPVAGDASQTLQQLQTLSRGCVLPVSSVSPMLHVYRFTGVANVALLRQRLLTWPLVQDVVPDAKARSHTPP